MRVTYTLALELRVRTLCKDVHYLANSVPTLCYTVVLECPGYCILNGKFNNPYISTLSPVSPLCVAEEMIIAIGEVKEESFMRLLGTLVGLVLLYGAEVWGCCRQTDPLVQVQLQAARIFLGRLHPRSAIEYEMRMMPLVWEAKRRCIEFWTERVEDERK